jgi:predicted N-acetyltransferase YhbS
VDYQVRAARITDVERIVALWTAVEPSAAEAADAATDLLRQLVYLPQASVLVAESARTIVGAAVLALRTSVRVGGNVGVMDLLVADPRHDAERVSELLAREVLRSARNKGCAVVEVALPAENPGLPALERHGFVAAAPRFETLLAAPRARAARG